MSPSSKSPSTHNSSIKPSSKPPLKYIPPPSKPPLKYVPPPLKSIPPPLKSIPPPLKSIPPPLKSIPPPLKSIPPLSQQSSEINNKNTNSGGFFSSVMDGFSFGIGSSVAREVVGGIFGSSSNNQQTSKVEIPHNKIHPDISTPEYIPNPKCKTFQEEYVKCIQSSNTDSTKSNCDFLLNIFSDCEKEWKNN